MKKFFLLFSFFSIVVFGFVMPKFLTPDEAFKPHIKLNGKAQIVVDIELAKGIYVYKDKISIKLKDSKNIIIQKIVFPKSEILHKSEVYRKSPHFVVDLKNIGKKLSKENLKVLVSYQGCSEDGLCYEPETKEFNLDVDISKLDSSIKKDVEISQTDSIAQTIKNGNIFIILVTFFGFGILLSLTPCVFPMVPIISGMIISHGKNITISKAFMLSVVYVLAMAIAYTIAGVLAGLFGANLQVALQTPWVIYSFSAVFVLLAFSMFGFYELKLPDVLVSKVSKKNSATGFVGVAIMGFLSALIVGPCVAAPLAGALVYIGQTGDALLGGMALFTMSVGMGLPLIVVGVSAGKFMPKPGAWMTMVNAIFGVLMLGVAIWMVEKVVSIYVVMILYGMLGIGTALYLGVFDNAKVHIFKKSVAVILFIYSVSLFLGALGGSKSMFQPLSFLKGSMVVKNDGVKSNFIVIHSIDELNKQLQLYKGKNILLDFSAKWCVACKELEDVTFSDERVKVKMKDFVLIRADVTQNTPSEKELSRKYGVFGPPAILFFNKDSKLLDAKTIVGFIKPNDFLLHLNSLII